MRCRDRKNMVTQDLDFHAGYHYYSYSIEKNQCEGWRSYEDSQTKMQKIIAPPSAGLEPATSGLEVPRAAIAPRRLLIG